MTEQMQRPFGIHRIGDIYSTGVQAGLPDGRWVYAPCLPYDGNRLKAAWWVLTGRAYAFLWPKAGELEEIWKAEQRGVNKLGNQSRHPVAKRARAMIAIWNKIEFDPWSSGDVRVSTNAFGEGPIILELEGDGFETLDLSEWMTPKEARVLAAKLIEAADAVDRAGPMSPADRGGAVE